MNRPEWLKKLPNTKLQELLSATEEIEQSCGTNDETILALVNEHYDNVVGLERLLRFSIDVWKEAALRWSECKK